MLFNKMVQKVTFKYLWTLMVFILLILPYAKASAQNPVISSQLTAEEQIWISEHRSIKASINTSYAPIDFVSAGQPTGFSVDYLNLLATKVGLNIEYVNDDTLSNNLEMLRNKEIDLVHSISHNEERARHFIFSNSYLDSHVVNYGRIGSPKINNIDDFEGRKVGIVSDTILHDAYERLYPQIELVEFSNVPDALRALAASVIDVYTGNLIGTDYLIEQTSISGLEVIGNDLVLGNEATYEHSIATHKDNQILMGIIVKAMAGVNEDEYLAISEKWIAKTGNSVDIGLTSEERDWLAMNNQIGVTALPNSPPIEFIDQNGNISGISGSYLEIIAKKLNVNFHWAQNETLGEGFNKIKASEAYIASAVALNSRLHDFLSFTDSYLEVGYVIFARSDNAVFGSLGGLEGRKIAQVSSFAITEYIRQNHPDIEIIEVGTIAEALHMVDDGKVDAFVGSLPSATSIIALDRLMQVNVIGDTPFQAFISIAVSNETPLLYSAIEKAMASITTKEHNDISTKWMALRVEEVENYDLIWQIALVFSFILVIFLIWNRKLAAARMEANSARWEAEEANKAKSAFFAAISHDLRTPLNAIIGFSEVIKNETYGSIENKKYLEYNQDIHNSGEYLLRLVNDILDVSALEAGEKTLSCEIVYFEEIARSCQNLVHKLAQDKNINFTVNLDQNSPPLFADQQALMQILMNIVSNAIKFTPSGGAVTISGYSKGNYYCIEVSDTGIGISEKDIKSITEPFRRAGSTSHLTQPEGTGLGLAIVKALIELHTGMLDIKSELGHGTTITVSIPVHIE